jgi:hypothetical protein
MYFIQHCFNCRPSDSTVLVDAGIEPGFGILEQSMGARNRVGIWLSYRPARLQKLAESISWIRFLGALKV